VEKYLKDKSVKFCQKRCTDVQVGSLEVRWGVDKRGNQRNKIVKDERIWCSMYEKWLMDIIKKEIMVWTVVFA